VEESPKKEYISLFTQAYKLFSNRKTLLEVAVALDLRESEAAKFLLRVLEAKTTTQSEYCLLRY
jgi:hypothetical protein